MTSERRIKKIENLLRDEAAGFLAKEADWPEGVLATVTHVSLSSNRTQAKIYVSIYPLKRAQDAKDILQSIWWPFQQLVNKKLAIRPSPKIEFEIDTGPAEADNIERLIEENKAT